MAQPANLRDRSDFAFRWPFDLTRPGGSISRRTGEFFSSD
jgi:hypothetical protein